jgi:hypothetical protein
MRSDGMKTLGKVVTAAILMASGLASPALATHETVAVIDGACVAASEPEGCTFFGNVNASHVAEIQGVYNALDPVRYDAPITLNYLANTEDPDFLALGGSLTGVPGTSGTWSLPGYLVDFVAVKAGDHFTLYKLASAASSGSWTTADMAFLHNDTPQELSHIVFFGGAVPEPESWALMIAGFGLVGGAVRRRRALASA